MVEAQSVNKHTHTHRAGLRGYVQFNKYTYTHAKLQFCSPQVGSCCTKRSFDSEYGCDGPNQLCLFLRYFCFFCHTDRLVCITLCVFFPFILGINFVGRTSRGHTGGRLHRISHPPYFCGACLTSSCEKDSAIPFPRRP